MNMNRYSIIIAFVALALCACNPVDTLNSNKEVSPVYHLNLKVGFDSQTKGVSFPEEKKISSFFEETDCIYVYNETKDAFARSADGTFITLNPKIITGTSCILSGNLSFYKWDEDHWENVSVDVTDTYALYYQLNLPGTGYSMTPTFNYTSQDGGKASVSAFDFAEASGISMTLSGNTLTVPDGVRLTNLQSIFRQRLSFTGTVPGTITALKVSTENGTLVDMYSPTDTDNPYHYDSFALVPPSLSDDNDVYLSLAFHYDADHSAEDDVFILTVTDENGNVYVGEKDVPSDGFVPGKYYYGAMTLDWQGQFILPKVTYDETLYSCIIYSDGEYAFNLSENDPTVVAIAGSSIGYYFTFSNSACITLGDEGTAIYSGTEPFIYSDEAPDGKDLVIVLSSNYTIDCRNNDSAIWAEYNLKLKTEGSSPYTLTVIANEPDYKGLYGWSNYDGDEHTAPADLAFDENYTVELTGTTPVDEDNDGNTDYYIWEYTVTPKTN